MRVFVSACQQIIVPQSDVCAALTAESGLEQRKINNYLFFVANSEQI